MYVISSGVVEGVIADRFGKRGEQFGPGEVPTYSLPLQICEPPQGTQSYALVLEDRDAFAVTPGFSWIHWTAANLQRDFLEENESVSARDFVQGINSWISEGLPLEDCIGYGGMAPPDCPHQYELRVYALDCLLPLEQGFLYGELYRAMEGHLLDSCVLKGWYRA